LKAPKGRDMTAQGIALGEAAHRESALKGREIYARVDHPTIAPLQGSGFSLISPPRALPWADLFYPLGDGNAEMLIV
jgi:hypothetical protein